MLRLASLSELNEDSSRGFGGKTRGLVRLRRHGARVPDAFAVEPTCDGPEAWPAPVLDQFKARVADLLASGAVAVRSSAQAEDSADHSYAGLFDTVLGVDGGDGALDAARRVVASGAGPRVLAYARSAVPVGLVVQRQIAARAGGVCFTIDPTGHDRAVVIEAVAGIGDALVSGHATPERWRVYRTGFGTWDARRTANAVTPVLEEREAAAVAAEAHTLAARFGHPLDLEWAIDDARTTWWLQARPVTAATLPHEFDVERLHDGVDDGPVTVWSNWNLREVMPDPLTPLAWTLWRDMILPAVAEPIFGVRRDASYFRHVIGIDRVHGRLYWNMNALAAAPLARLFLSPALELIDSEAAPICWKLVSDGALRPRRLPMSKWRLLPAMATASLRSAVGVWSGLRPERALAALAAAGDEIRRRPDVTTLGDAALLDEILLFDQPWGRRFARGMQALAAAVLVYGATHRVFAAHAEARGLLTAGLSGNPTTDISIAIDRLVQAARPVAELFGRERDSGTLSAALATTPAGAEFLRELELFLGKYGHRCPGEFSFHVPRWTENPTMIFDLVRTGLAANDGENVEERLARLRARREAAVAAAARSEGPLKRWLMRKLASALPRFMPLREAPKHHAMVAIARMRSAILELGRRLVRRGALTAAEDVYYLEWPEARDLSTGRALQDLETRVRARREAFLRHERQRPPLFLRSDGVPVEAGASSQGPDGTLRGVGACGGVGIGRARRLRTPDPHAFEAGDVLVVEYADPGWTPLFPRAAGLVMEVGGLMCHAAVVARELGIPAVFGVVGAMHLLRDGQRLEVDGDRGRVRPLDIAIE